MLASTLPVQRIYEFDPVNNMLYSEVEADGGVIENSHAPDPAAISIFGDRFLDVNVDECLVSDIHLAHRLS